MLGRANRKMPGECDGVTFSIILGVFAGEKHLSQASHVLRKSKPILSSEPFQ